MTRRLVLISGVGLASSLILLTSGWGLSGGFDRNSPSLFNVLTATCGSTGATDGQLTLRSGFEDQLKISAPAQVRYNYSDDVRLVISGKQAVLDHIRLERGRLTLNCEPSWEAGPLVIDVFSPGVADWTLNGSVELVMTDVRQSHLKLDIRGTGNVTAAGSVDSLDMTLSGAGKVAMKDLTAQVANVSVRGNGYVVATATKSADISIYGSGDVELYGNPEIQSSDIRGSGRVIQKR